MSTLSQNIQMVHGDTTPFYVTVLDRDGTLFNPTGSSFWFTVKTMPTVVDASAVFQLTSQGYQECGLTGKTSTSATGLSNTSTYYFKVTKDGGAQTEKSITTAADTTYGAVIILMNAQMTGALAGCVWSVTSAGDLRCTSPTFGASSSIALAAGSTGTNLFATLTGFVAFEAQKNSGDIIILDAPNGQVQILVPASQGYTPAFGYADTVYLYDLQMTDAYGAVDTIAKGRLTVLADLTRA